MTEKQVLAAIKLIRTLYPKKANEGLSIAEIERLEKLLDVVIDTFPYELNPSNPKEYRRGSWIREQICNLLDYS